ncbi:hypothetical protein GCM10027034_36610 [Ramlibacter solisilvae]|uniref:hypothetical protein n=1 Tax=Ramlibacter tataouinensis TaxID=94132 RepID=UPI0011AE33C5|nr:hypothetical protein [Ramlibacter tataouinensis]
MQIARHALVAVTFGLALSGAMADGVRVSSTGGVQQLSDARGKAKSTTNPAPSSSGSTSTPTTPTTTGQSPRPSAPFNPVQIRF